MKTQYFSDDNIQAKARRMLDEIEPYTRSDVQAYIPSRSALLILDMQRIFLDRESHAFVPSAQAILSSILALRDAYLKRGHRVILTRHLNAPEDAGMMTRRWNELILEEEASSELVPELKETDDLVITKSQYDAFYGTRLDQILRDGGVEQLVITGVMTHLCVETTARSAFMHGYTVWMPVDGTATYNEAFHRAAMMNLSHGFVNPMMMGTLIEAVEASADVDA